MSNEQWGNSVLLDAYSMKTRNVQLGSNFRKYSVS